MYNENKIRQQALDHYTELASNPGWRNYCWKQVQAMAKENPAMYWDLPEKVKNAMEKKLSDERQRVGASND